LNRDRLANAYLLAGSLAARTEPQTQPASQIRPRDGAVQEAVIRALAEAKRPLQAREIHQAAQKLAGMPLSWNTVKDCLHKHARRPESPIEHVGHGRYRHQ
jgi:HB1, ASXL, restriction endonuclease HTH domain